MSLPNATHVACEVGRYYMVPCIATTPEARAWFALPGGWVPVMGPKHEDAEHLEFPEQHYHIDWRFVHNYSFRIASGRHGFPHSQVLTSTHGKRELKGTPVMRKARCLRVMPDFPLVAKVITARDAGRWDRLERAQFTRCSKLKPGNVCPHRGIDLTPFEQPDGTAICPGHGLRWNLRTGDLMPRHSVETA
jgi:hypothetical protein